MCWPKKVSDRSYNSYTKFGQMMGYYTHKIIFSKVLCKSCRICSVAELLGESKNIRLYEQLQWQFKANGIIRNFTMVLEYAVSKYFVTLWIVSDYDSKIHVVLKLIVEINPDDKQNFPFILLNQLLKPIHHIVSR